MGSKDPMKEVAAVVAAFLYSRKRDCFGEDMAMMVRGKNRILRVILTITGVLFFSGAIPARGVTRIMPLGDSITRGYYGSPVNKWGYRKPLYDLLISDAYDFDFVGSCVSGSFPDPNHEGHDGWRSDQILSYVNGWLVSSQPDVVLLHIGTNDITQGYRSRAGDAFADWYRRFDGNTKAQGLFRITSVVA